MTTQFLPNFIANSCCGCHSSAKRLLQKAIGKKSSGIIKKYEQIKKPVYSKNYYESGIVCVNDLLFNISTNDSFDYFAKQISKINILQWAGLRHSILDFLKGDYTSPPLTSPSFLIHDNIFDVTKKKSKDYYLLLVTEKAQPPNNIQKWKSNFNLSDDNLREFFLLPHTAVLESYVKAFQYKVLHNILYTNTKLFKIGFRTDDVCTFCEAEPET